MSRKAMTDMQVIAVDQGSNPCRPTFFCLIPMAVRLPADPLFISLIRGKRFLSPMTERMDETLVILKPDAIARGLELDIFNTFLHEDLFPRYWLKHHATPDQVRMHYARAIAKYGPKLEQWSIDYFTGGELVLGILTGADALSRARALCGEDMDPAKCPAHTIRGRFGIDSIEKAVAEGGGEQRRGVRNVIHSSSSPEEYVYERGIWVPQYSLAS